MARISDGPHFDGREMTMVHRMFRREFTLMPGLVRGVAAGDRDRARFVGEHIRRVGVVLHHHHNGEDEYVWPLLRERASERVLPLVHLMESQHQDVAKLGDEVESTLVSWLDDATSESRAALAGALDRLVPVLREHLALEEERIVPVMEEVVTLAEWNEIVMRIAGDLDPVELPLALGMAIYEGDPEIVEATIANMPAEVRPVIGPMANQAYAAYSERLHGTPTPPLSTEL